MNTATQTLTDSFESFFTNSGRFLHIQSEPDYEDALEAVEELMVEIGNTQNHHLEPLFSLLSHAITVYEDEQKDMKRYLKKYRSLSPDIALLKVLMEQHQLGTADFKEEIGSKSYVSMILNDKRQLTKEHIQKLSKRFKISPALFF